jgi:tetratricopeptide (TPR) repeat protein
MRHPARKIGMAAALLLAGLALPATAATTPADDDERLERPFAATPEMAQLGWRLSRIPGGTQEKANAIVRYIFSDPDGLQFEYRNRPTLTAEQAFEQRAGNCVTLVNLFIALARSAGLEAFPVEVEDLVMFTREGTSVVRSTHVIGGLALGGQEHAGNMWTVDFLPGERKAYRKMFRISDRRHAALHYNSVAVEAMFEDDLAGAERLFGQALELDRGTVEAWSNYAVLARRQGELDAAFARLEKALALDRDFMPALTNMASFNRLAGRPEVARQYEERALEAKLQNPYFLLDQALRHLQREEIDEAYALAQRARRVDNGVPEAYLVLGRIDLARGRLARAERNFATARTMSRELSPAYRQGVDRKIDKLLHVASVR